MGRSFAEKFIHDLHGFPGGHDHFSGFLLFEERIQIFRFYRRGTRFSVGVDVYRHKSGCLSPLEKPFFLDHPIELPHGKRVRIYSEDSSESIYNLFI